MGEEELKTAKAELDKQFKELDIEHRNFVLKLFDKEKKRRGLSFIETNYS